MVDQRRARSFGPAVVAYEQGRPDYQPEHVAWLLEGVGGPVLDLGAGSGKLTRVIAGLGFSTIAVDPDPAMLTANRVGPTMVGSAEQLPLAARSVAAVTVGQAWHWFDQDLAAAEVARVLRPGGRLALVWNDLDEGDPFVAELAAIIDRPPPERDAMPTPSPAGFGPVGAAVWRWRRELTLARLVAYVRSRSSYLIAGADEQQRVVAAVMDLLATHPATAGAEEFPIAMVTAGFRTDLLP